MANQLSEAEMRSKIEGLLTEEDIRSVEAWAWETAENNFSGAVAAGAKAVYDKLTAAGIDRPDIAIWSNALIRSAQERGAVLRKSRRPLHRLSLFIDWDKFERRVPIGTRIKDVDSRSPYEGILTGYHTAVNQMACVDVTIGGVAATSSVETIFYWIDGAWRTFDEVMA